MPINPNVRTRNHLTGGSKMTPGDQITAIFEFLGLHEMAPVFERPAATDGAPKPRRGRQAAYPPIALLAVLAAARATGSLTSAIALLHKDRQLWERCVTAFEQRSGVRLPPIPPTRDQVLALRDKIVDDPSLLAGLQLRFRVLAVGQARLQGNLTKGVEPNGADPQEAHTIYGDGTIIAKYSDVRHFVDPATGEVHILGSRAKDPNRARIQELASDTSEDQKVSNGLNMVAMHTWTPSGRVTLGTAVALGGEAWAALELAESLHEIAGDGIHSLVYDRAITGWHVDHLMANCRIQVIGKAVGASSQQAAWDGTTDDAVRDTVRRRMAEKGIPEKPEKGRKGHSAFVRDAAFVERRDVLADMLMYHERMPLGLCIYPTSNRNFDLVRSWASELDPQVHDGPDGPCVHRLAVDDGGLYEVEDHPEEDGQAVKTRVLRCHTSTPYRRPDGKWGTNNRYTIDCPHGDIEYERTWKPTGMRYSPATDKNDRRAPEDAVGWRLRPLSRADDIATWYNDAERSGRDHFAGARPFSDVYSRRNDAESYNEWYQRSLPHHGRAASLNPAAQELDFLLGALLNNTITWANRD